MEMEQKKVTMTKDQIIAELIDILRENNRVKQAEELSGLAAYVENLEEKIDGLTHEVIKMNRELSELRIQKNSAYLRNALANAISNSENRILDMRRSVSEIRSELTEKASMICTEFKRNGKKALNRMSEFLGLKNMLDTMREDLRQGIVDTDRTIARIEGFEAGIKSANDQLVNSFRVLAGKEKRSFSEEEFFKNNTTLLKKPWLWQKNVYQNLLPFFDGAIERLDKLSSDVQVSKMLSRWDELYDKTHATPEKNQIEKTVLVSEKQPVYGGDAFDAYIEKNAKMLESAKVLEAVNVKEKGYSL